MIISNFHNVKNVESKVYQCLYAVVADVDVTTTTGYLLCKRTTTVTRQVFKDEMSLNWIWTDTGEWTPRFIVEKLYNAYTAQEKIKEMR